MVSAVVEGSVLCVQSHQHLRRGLVREIVGGSGGVVVVVVGGGGGCGCIEMHRPFGIVNDRPSDVLVEGLVPGYRNAIGGTVTRRV